MIKIQNNTATREPLPAFLRGLSAESLADLSWTDPALGVSDCAWWPEEDQSPPIGTFERYGAETLAPDAGRKVVVITRAVEPWPQEEIDAHMADVAGRKLQAVNEGKNAALDGGFELNGTLWDSDSKARLAYLELSLKLGQDPAYSAPWKASTGVWVTMDAALFSALQPAYEAHIAGCFAWQAAREAEVAAAVQAGDVEALAGVAEVFSQ